MPVASSVLCLACFNCIGELCVQGCGILLNRLSSGSLGHHTCLDSSMSDAVCLLQVFFVQDPATGGQSKRGTLRCVSPPLSALNLPPSASATVRLQVSMDAGNGWMQFAKDPNFRYYLATQFSPSFGPQHDQRTQVSCLINSFWPVHASNAFESHVQIV